MEKRSQLYEGKAKKVFATDDSDRCIVSYKDDATAFNGLKKGSIEGKGAINNQMSNFLFQMLEKQGVPTHFIEQLNARETVVRRVEIVPLEVIIRNKAAGSFSKRFGIEEGSELNNTILEYCLKDDDLGDPMINESQILAAGFATQVDLDTISRYAYQVNEGLKAYFAGIGIELIDFKLEFGKFHDEIVLADEISPDTCRFWDAKTHEKLDKDRFRRDMGNVEDAYQDVFSRLGIQNADEKKGEMTQ